MGGTGERRTLRIAAQYADGWNAAYVSAERYRHLMGVLDDHCQSSGRDPATIRRTVNVIFALSDDGTSTERRNRPAGLGADGTHGTRRCHLWSP